MQPQFSNLEVLQYAVSMEAGGVDFYEEHAKKAEGDIKALFLKLADDERKHAAYFQKLYSQAEKEEGSFDYMFEETVTGVFDEYAKSAGFSREVGSVNSVKDAIKEAIVTETITVSLYEEMLKFAKEKTADTIKGLIAEEEEHRDLLKAMLERA